MGAGEWPELGLLGAEVQVGRVVRGSLEFLARCQNSVEDFAQGALAERNQPAWTRHHVRIQGHRKRHQTK